MTVKSMFGFRFPEVHAEEGVAIARSIGADVIPLAGYLDHEVTLDVEDPGHVMVNTRWESREAAWAMLETYRHHIKIEQVTKLIGAEPTGFVGEVGR